MSASHDLAAAAEQLLQMPGFLSVNVPVLRRRKGEPANDIEAAIAQQELCIYVMPPFPTRAERGVDVVFFSKAELRIRIMEQVKLNSRPVNAYDLIDEIANGLHWQPTAGVRQAVDAVMAAQECDEATALATVQADPVYEPLFAMGRILAHPLQIADRPVEEVSDPNTRIIDVLFEATYELRAGVAET